ncbi:cytochrome p450 [Rhyzopertha dominica]|nr:cytochrome p450 [Rhyzopertha dominica]
MLPMCNIFCTIVFATIGIVIFSFLAYSRWWAHTYWTRAGIPQIHPFFLLGSAYDRIKHKESLAVLFAKLYREIQNKGLKYCGVYLFTKPILLVCDLEVIRNVLVKDFDHFQDRGFYKNERDDPLSNNLLTQDGQEWRNMRKKLSPTFTSGQLKWMFDVLLECTKYVPDILEKHINGDPISIKDVFERITMDSFGSCAFGINCNTLINPEAEFLKYSKEATNTNSRNICFRIVINLLPYHVNKRLGLRRFSVEVENFFMRVVKESVKLREKKTVYRRDLMQLLVELKEKEEMALEDVVAQAFIFFIAAFDTTSNTLTFAMVEISRNLDIQDKLRKEILSVLEKYDGKITYDAINEMEYLDCVVEETLRKYCPAPFLTRKCTKDYTMPNTSHKVKKGTLVIIPSYGIHQDPEYYHNPEIFDPERFMWENRKKIPQMAYLPFGVGPRNCIGLRFGRMQTKVALCSLLKNYRFTVNEKTEYPIKFHAHSVVWTSRDEIWLDVHKI